MKAPPIADHALERRYLAGAMIDPRILDEHPLPIGVFGHDAHREVAAAMASIAARGERVTEERLDHELEDRRHYATRALRPFSWAVVLPDDPAALCERLRGVAARRELARGTDEALRMLAAGDPLLSVQAHLARLADLEIAAEDRTAAVHLHGPAAEALRETQRAAEGTARATFTTGLPPLDDLFDGWDRGDMLVIAGDSGAGKSTTMLLMARAQARAGERVLIVSVEDHAVRWGRRTLYAGSGVSIRQLKSGDLRASEWQNLDAALAQVEGETIWFAAPLGGDLDEVMHTIRRARALHNITVVYVDYLQAIAQPPAANADHALRHHIRDCLEAGRRETGRGAEPLTLIFGSQYRKREDETKRPRNSDLYEANYIHQKADAILHLWKLADGERRWWLGKHKDQDPAEGTLARDPRTGLLAGGSGTSDHEPAQVSLEDEWGHRDAR